MSQFKSSLLNIAFFTSQEFSVPAYQRPYVWGETQIKKMLQDIWETFDRNINETYYLGTIVTAQSTVSNEEELIDGQQRFTTLWLIALAFERLKVNSILSSFLRVNEKVRLKFEIRTEVQNYLQKLADNPGMEDAFNIPKELLKDQPYLSGIAQAGEIILKELSQYFKKKEDSNAALIAFAEYIATHVMFVKNTAPQHTDLKKLFTTLNNSGIQLEQADILKSRFLKRITEDKLLYSKIWESCENMDNYFEQNVKECFQRRPGITDLHFAKYSQDYYTLTVTGGEENSATVKFSLSEILDAPDEQIDMKTYKTPDGRSVICESIITFPQLLLHTLRIYLNDKNLADIDLPFHASNLLESFEIITASGQEDIKYFFRLLWEVRYVFDKHVVKWVEKNGERTLGIRPVAADLFRAPVKEHSSKSMLQSMLYHTTNYNTQIWLSPYLKGLLNGEKATADLERIDDYLSLSLSTDKSATWDIMSGVPLSERFDYATYLAEANSTHFKHYWFYKLEYILFKGWPKGSDKQFKNYRITSKNSVEHICSQQDEYGKKLYDKDGMHLLHTFGNLTLLSVGQNSGYGNQHTGKKIIDHRAKDTYDSLKLAKLFQLCQAEVTAEAVMQHQSEMMHLLNLHYGLLLTTEDEVLEQIAEGVMEGEE